MTVNIEGLGKITASKYVLSQLVITFANSATYYMRGNMFGASETEEKRSDTIYEQLLEVGYYNDKK